MIDAAPLGHEIVGSGPSRVLVLNDWLSDCSTWDGARRYLDQERFTWSFADLRGYGRSRGRSGSFTLLEAAADVLALVDALGWNEISLVGHSMSTLVAIHVAQHHPARVRRLVLLTPPPPRGFGADAAWLAATEKTVRDEAQRRAMAHARFSERYSAGWAAYKTERWIATSDATAAAGYVAMFARDGVPEPDTRIDAPVLAVTGEDDMPPLRRDAVLGNLTPLCPSLEVIEIAGCGHYPMQEAPPRTVAVVERFIA